MPESPEKEEALRKASRIVSPETKDLYLLIDNLQDYVIFSMDTQGRVASWNVGAERIHGYPAHDVIGKHFSIFYPEEDLVRIADDCIREVRTISYLLYPPMLEEMGLQMAIEWHVGGFVKRSGIRVDCEVDILGSLGVGLRGMNERVRQLGGKLESSSSEEGMTVRAVIPIRSLASSAARPDGFKGPHASGL